MSENTDPKQGNLFDGEAENDFVKYVVVGFRADNSLDIGIPQDITITVSDLWAFSNLLRVKADNFYSLMVDNVHGATYDGINKIIDLLSQDTGGDSDIVDTADSE